MLAQGSKGVPIGGYLSAHLCIVWCILRERLLLDSDPNDDPGAEERFSDGVAKVHGKWSLP